jgi:hypothetical protein
LRGFALRKAVKGRRIPQAWRYDGPAHHKEDRMRHCLLVLLTPLMFGGSVQALAAGPKSGLDKLDFAGAPPSLK